MSISREIFGQTPDGLSVNLYTLSNKNHIQARLINYGAILVSLEVPDKHGNFADVVLGYDTLREYIDDQSAFGASIGRFANLIAHGHFKLNGKDYNLEQNQGKHHLHGGSIGFNKRIFEAAKIESAEGSGVSFKYLSVNGEQGYPGNLKVEFRYTLTHDNILRVEFIAETDQDTPVNLTHHSYFNLKGDGNGNILEHELKIYADRYTGTDSDLIPTGKIIHVKNTPLDFRNSRKINAHFDKYPELYDDNFVLNGPYKTFKKTASLLDPESGRKMEIFTTQPGLQVYTANHIDGIRGKKNKVYHKHPGIAFEPQHFPDSVNHTEFPNTILKPGEKFYQKSEFRFSTMKKL